MEMHVPKPGANVTENNTAFHEVQSFHDNIALFNTEIERNLATITRMQDELKSRPGLAGSIAALEEENRIIDIKILSLKKQIEDYHNGQN